MNRITILVIAALLLAAGAANAAPVVSLTSDVHAVPAGGTGVLTATVGVPSTDPAVKSVAVNYSPPAPLTVISASGPKLVNNFCTAGWTDLAGAAQSSQSNAAPWRLQGVRVTYTPGSPSSATVPLGDLFAGESDFATFTAKSP